MKLFIWEKYQVNQMDNSILLVVHANTVEEARELVVEDLDIDIDYKYNEYSRLLKTDPKVIEEDQGCFIVRNHY